MSETTVPMKEGIATGSENPLPRTAQVPADDEVLKEMKAMLRQSVAEGNPCVPGLKRIMESYGKLLRRFNKIVSISDGYQTQLMELKARLEIAARTDLLTGLGNRWEIMSRLEAEKSRAERYGSTFSVLIGDLDHFKTINDTHGHLAGDRVLRMVADTLRSSVRAEDFCGRWGGEEFLLILPETGLANACAAAEKLLAEVRHGEVLWEERSISVTMSFGVGTFTRGMGVDECIKLVDDALYVAKQGGRDRYRQVSEQQGRAE